MSTPGKAARDDLVAALGSAMQQYHRAVQAFDDAVGRRLDLGPSDLRCLDRLADGPATAGELATAIGLRPAATTALVDRLARRGLVRRTRSETDRRIVVVEMTERGHAVTWDAYAPLVAAGRPLLDALSTDQLRLVTDYLRGITRLTDVHRERLDRPR